MTLRLTTSHFPRARRASAYSLALAAAIGLLLSALPLGCSGDDSPAEPGSQGGTDEVPSGGGSTSGEGGAGAGNGNDGGVGDGDGDGDSSDLSGNGDNGTGLGRAGFRFGINLGHPNPDFDDSEMSDLGAAVGNRSIRLKYPEYHFYNWGQDIEVGDAKHYAELGMTNHVAFLTGMIEQHSTAPSGSADWLRDEYIPRGLYEPIFTDAGEVNPDNYYATYLADTFTTYKPWVKYWEIFNEPDWVSSWLVSETWFTEPPSANDLERFHGSIFDYVRMLRIATSVRDFVAPGTYILTGGLGYPSFVSALLRYTDNPDGGKVTDRFPKTGAAYFDVLSVHYYPHLLDDGNSDAALARFEQYKSDMMAELEKAGASSKGFMVTETGAAHEPMPGAASGSEYARNYLQKAMIWGKAEGMLGIDWFTLTDGASATDAFSRMGLYTDVSSLTVTSAAVETESGIAYLTTSHLLGDARLDIAKTDALALPDSARGYVFARESDSVYVLWAMSDSGEEGEVTTEIPAQGNVELWAWDAGSAGPSRTISATGSLQVMLTASPQFYVVAKN